jgi:hypothetical protein
MVLVEIVRELARDVDPIAKFGRLIINRLTSKKG